MYAVIMAGGTGTRFWPRSRERKPKQFLAIFGNKTLIQLTVDRIRPIIPDQNILFVLNPQQKPLLLEQFPQLTEENIILEPFGKNTAPAIGLAAVHLLARDENAVMVALPADHIILKEQVFRKALQIGAKIASEHDGLITIGITPDRPATGYGYIQHNEKIYEEDGIPVHKVKTFAEKPNYETAVRFLRSGDFLWNSGMFIWRASVILDEIRKYLPEMYTGLMQLREVIGTDRYAAELETFYRQIRSISIDYGVMEKAQKVFVIKCDLGWSDVGSWDEVYKLSDKDKQGNAITGNGLVLKSKNCYVFSEDDLVALVGVENLIVVKSDNAILVCSQEHAQDIRELVDYLKRKNMQDYL